MLDLQDVKYSKVEIIDDYHIKSLEWGSAFEVAEKVQDITHIGIRAHDFLPAEKDDINSFDTINATKIGNTF